MFFDINSFKGRSGLLEPVKAISVEKASNVIGLLMVMTSLMLIFGLYACKLVELIRGGGGGQTKAKKPQITLKRTIVLLKEEISRPPITELKRSCPNLLCFDLFHKAELHPVCVTRSADRIEQLRKEKTDFVGVGRRGLLRTRGGGDAFNRRCF